MIQPQAYKLKCPECGHSKTIRPKSDVMDSSDMFSICPKCKINMEKKKLTGLSKIFSDIFK